MGDDHPPTDDEGFLEFARSLPIPNVYESLMAAEPLGPIYRSGSTENRLCHYERLRRFPEHFVLVGDSVCAPNPLYGHGITNATLGALALDEELTRQRTIRPQGGSEELGPRFQKRLARLNKDVWMRATSADGAWPHTRGIQRSDNTLREGTQARSPGICRSPPGDSVEPAGGRPTSRGGRAPASPVLCRAQPQGHAPGARTPDPHAPARLICGRRPRRPAPAGGPQRACGPSATRSATMSRICGFGRNSGSTSMRRGFEDRSSSEPTAMLSSRRASGAPRQ